MSTSDDLKQTSQDFIRQLLQGDFAGAGRLFDAHLAQALPEPKLKETWLQIVGQVGAFQKILAYQAEEIPEKHLVTVTCQFDKLPIDFHMVFNQDGKLSALNAQPASALLSYNPPAYVRLATFHEVDVTVGSGEWALPGTLSLPQGDGPFPAVVLVHGSGLRTATRRSARTSLSGTWPGAWPRRVWLCCATTSALLPIKRSLPLN